MKLEHVNFEAKISEKILPGSLVLRQMKRLMRSLQSEVYLDNDKSNDATGVLPMPSIYFGLIGWLVLLVKLAPSFQQTSNAMHRKNRQQSTEWDSCVPEQVASNWMQRKRNSARQGLTSDHMLVGMYPWSNNQIAIIIWAKLICIACQSCINKCHPWIANEFI